MLDDITPTSTSAEGLTSASSVPSSKRPLTNHEQHLLLGALHLALHRCGLPGTLRFLGNDVIEWEHPRGVERAPLPAFAYRTTRLAPEEFERHCREFARTLAKTRAGNSTTGDRKASLPGEAYVGLGLAVAALALLGYFLFERSAAPTPERSRAATSLAPTCEELSRQYRLTGQGSRERLDKLELHLVLLARGAGEPLDALEGFSEYFRSKDARFGISAPKIGQRPAKVTRSKPTARGETLRILDIDYGESSAGALADSTLDPSGELTGPLGELGMSAAALVTRCPSSPLSVEAAWFYGESDAALLATAMLFSDGYSDTPWLAEPFLHPPSESETNPAFAFLTLREALGGKLASNRTPSLAMALSFEPRPPGFVLLNDASRRPAFLGKIRTFVLENRLGSAR